jgi:hypothetical protein
MPNSAPEPGNRAASVAVSVSTTKEAKNLPAASLITVTLDGSDGSGRDQRTETSPMPGKRSFRPTVISNRALRVNRIACLRSFRDRNWGAPTFGPFRFPAVEARKLR